MVKIAETEPPIDAVRKLSDVRGHDRFPVRVKRILVPTDLSNQSDKAIEFGAFLAKHFSAKLTLLHVYQESYATQYVRGPDAYNAVLEERSHLQNSLESIAKDVRERYADCETEFRDGVPCEEIVDRAKQLDIDLIVISTHHYNWLTRLAYGCDAEQILRHAPCPILVLKVQPGLVPERYRTKTR
jgi:universal stress protein A